MKEKEQGFGRRDFLKGAVVGGAAAATTTTNLALPQAAQAQQAAAAAAAGRAGYAFLNLEEAAFVEALVDHMVPADELTPKGTDIGINVYHRPRARRRLGQGRPPLHAGAVEARHAEPGLPAAAHAGAALSRRHRGDQRALPQDLRQAVRPARPSTQREEVLRRALHRQDRASRTGCRRDVFWSTLYQTVMEGMFSDPIYGGNRDKAGWKLIGFPGVIAVHRENVEKYRDKKFPADPVSIADMS